MADRFICPRCTYSRPLKLGEDGYRIYLIHEERCNPACGRQLWLPCITEDNLDFVPADVRGALVPLFRLSQQMDRDERCRVARRPAAASRKAA